MVHCHGWLTQVMWRISFAIALAFKRGNTLLKPVVAAICFVHKGCTAKAETKTTLFLFGGALALLVHRHSHTSSGLWCHLVRLLVFAFLLFFEAIGLLLATIAFLDRDGFNI